MVSGTAKATLPRIRTFRTFQRPILTLKKHRHRPLAATRGAKLRSGPVSVDSINVSKKVVLLDGRQALEAFLPSLHAAPNDDDAYVKAMLCRDPEATYQALLALRGKRRHRTLSECNITCGREILLANAPTVEETWQLARSPEQFFALEGGKPKPGLGAATVIGGYRPSPEPSLLEDIRRIEETRQAANKLLQEAALIQDFQ
eukprot:Skav228514  [mRNA]  locus=scaffold3621:37709:43662:+ [translate_table: standard]